MRQCLAIDVDLGGLAMMASEVWTEGKSVSMEDRTEGFAQTGENIVVAAGVPFGQSGSTNALRVASVK